MFRIFEKNGVEWTELFPNSSDGLYTVRELGHYQFEYSIPDNLIALNTVVLLEDEVINSKVTTTNSVIRLRDNLDSRDKRIFQNYFGFAALRINEKVVANFNITIHKLNKQEVEDIFTYLWERENKVFHNFLSRSSINANFHDTNNSQSLTSKFLTFVEKFHIAFSQNFYNFRRSPQSVLRTDKTVVPYTANAITVSSVEWLLSNLDEMMFDPSFVYHPDSIKIGNTYGCIEQIQTDLKKASYDVYENRIILGSFEKILLILASLKKEMSSETSLVQVSYSYGDQVDFRDLKKVSFLVLDKRIKDNRKKILSLYKKYKDFFFDATPNISKPKLTSAFSRKKHYRESFKLIKKLWNYKNLNLGNKLNLLSIKEFWKLYEIYNLHRLVQDLEDCLNLELFSKEIKSYDENGVLNHIEYLGEGFCLKLFYELKYYTHGENDTVLTRIDSLGKKNHYKPDYVIEISYSSKKKYFVFDSKYTSIGYTEKYLSEMILKYIVGTGLKNHPYQKIDFLGLLYPGYSKKAKIKAGFYPQISIIPSKPNNELELRKSLMNILSKNIPHSHLQKTV